MKKVLLSADNSICLYSVPDEVADDLEAYCMEFCMNWLRSSPDAAKYRVKRGNTVSFRYNEEDYISVSTFLRASSRKRLLKPISNRLPVVEQQHSS